MKNAGCSVMRNFYISFMKKTFNYAASLVMSPRILILILILQLTRALETLVEQSVQERPTVVTEGWRGVRMDLKLVPGAIGLELENSLIQSLFWRKNNSQNALKRKKRRIELDRNEIRKYYLQVLYWFRKLSNFYSF